MLSLCITQVMMAQLTSLGLVEESELVSKWSAIKEGALGFVPKLSFNGDYLYAATPNGLFRSSSASLDKWEKLPFTDELVVDFAVHEDTLIAISRNELFVSVDNGQTVKALSKIELMGDDISLQGVAVSPTDAKEVIVTNGYRLAVTHDGGAQWSMVEDVHLTKLYYNPLETNSFIGFNNSTAINECYYYYSTDGYSQWKDSEHFYEGLGNIAELYDIAFHPTQKGRVIACGLGRYSISDSHGASWTHICDSRYSPIVNVTDVEYDKRDPDILYAADMTAKYTNQLTILRSTDGGYTWDNFYSVAGEGAHALSISLQDNQLAIYTYSKGIFLLDVDAVEDKPCLVAEGKQWAVATYTYKNECWTDTYRLQGDTIINGKTYKIEHVARYEDLSDMKPSGRYMREEDGKVYSITDKDQRDDFVFNYSMEIGDTLFYNPTIDYYGNIYDYPVCLRLVAIRDTIMPNGDGRIRKCYDMEEGFLNSDDVYEFNTGGESFYHSYIEDIGYSRRGLSSSEIGTTGCGYSLLYVKLDDTMLYQLEEGVLWKDNTGIEVPHVNHSAPLYHDLQGRPVAHPTSGIYIKDGRKVILR